MISLIISFIQFNRLSQQAELIKDSAKLKVRMEILQSLNEAFSQVQWGVRCNDCSREDYIRVLNNFCTKLAGIYARITGHPCSVCIKLIASVYIPSTDDERTDEGDPYVALVTETVARDQVSSNRMRYDKNSPIQHLIESNTDFATILNHISDEAGRVFFCNALSELEQYYNTSFHIFDFPVYGFPPGTSVEEKERIWPLTYQSTIVAPICPDIESERNEANLEGYLCVDSSEKNTFSQGFDDVLLIGCAEGLVNILRKINDLDSQRNS